MKKIYQDITKTIGRTPMVKLSNIDASHEAHIFAKIESFNPLGSIKDRIGASLVEDAEKKGLIKDGTTIVEPTSGNTGVALAFICAQRGYKLILTMPESMSKERRQLLKIFGAEIVLTSAKAGMKGAVLKAEEIVKNTSNAFMPQQFHNQANPAIHFKITGPEIWKDTEGNVDIFVAGVGTGGTITGVGKFLKKKNKDIKVIAVEPEESAVLSGKPPGPHKIQGIGAGFIPDVMDLSFVDEIITVKYENAKNITMELAKKEGILAGASSGAALYAALSIAKKPENKSKNIIVILPDTGERYLTTDLFE